MNIYAFFDKKMNTFNNYLFLAPNDATAIRTMYDYYMDGGSLISKHPDDFSLYALGYFNNETGVIDPANDFVVDLSHHIKQQQQGIL